MESPLKKMKQEIAEKYGNKDWKQFCAQSQITPELEKIIIEAYQWGYDFGYNSGVIAKGLPL